MEIDGLRGGPFVLFPTVEVEGFGRTCLPVDGEGDGLFAGTYDLNVEMLRSRVARCRRLAATVQVAEWEAIAARAEAAVAAGDAVACGQLLGPAIIAAEELLCRRESTRPVSGGRPPVISATLFGERQGEWSIGVGPDWPRETPPDFTRSNLSFAQALEVIDGTTLPNFWRYVEYERDNYRWDRIDNILDRTRGRQLSLKSFTLCWGGIGGCPPWLRELTYRDQLAAIENWVTAMVRRYKGAVSCWETVNEMHDWAFGNPFAWDHGQRLEVTRLVNELVGVLDPGTPRLINHCCIWGHYVQSGEFYSWTGRRFPVSWSPLSYLDEVCAAGIPFEAIGLQFYNPGRDILTCYETLEKFLPFGKTIQITEMGTPSATFQDGIETGQVDPMAGWRGPWDENRQALWIDRFFRTVGRIPQVTALNYWDFDDAQAFIPFSGLVRKDGAPKAGYTALHEIAREWREFMGDHRGHR